MWLNVIYFVFNEEEFNIKIYKIFIYKGLHGNQVKLFKNTSF